MIHSSGQTPDATATLGGIGMGAGKPPAQLSASESYQAHQLTKVSLDFVVAEEQARNTVKGF
jgi:hypothetical protein